MKYLLHGCWAAMELGYVWFFCSGYFLPVRGIRKRLWLLPALWVVMTLLGGAALNPAIPVMMRLLAQVSVLLFLFGQVGQRGLAAVALASAMSLTLEYGMAYLLQDLLKVNEQLLILALTAVKAALLLCVFCLERITRQGHKQAGSWHNLVFLLPSAVMFVLMLLFCWDDPQGTMPAVLCGVLMLVNFTVLSCSRGLGAVSERELELQLQRQHMNTQTESILALEENYRLQRKATHDFERHIQVLDDLLSHGASEDAQEYVHRLRGVRAYRVISVNSGHAIIDVILNQKYHSAQINGVKIQFFVNDLSGIRLPTDSLVLVLSNLLDNALEACLRLDGYQEIDCSIMLDETLYISLANTSKPVQIVDGRIETSKDDKLRHGYGLSTVCEVLDRFGADYTFDYEDGWFRFVADIPNKEGQIIP